MPKKTYYLSSMESKTFSNTRQCLFLKTLYFDTGKKCVLAKITPAVIGENFGSAEDIEYVVLVSRHDEDSMSLLTEFPHFVFIAKSLVNDIGSKLTISKSDLQILAWGEIYRTKADADNHVFD